VRLTVGNKLFTTLLHHLEGETLWLVPPLQMGLPVSFVEGTSGKLEVALPSGIYSASIRFTERRVKPSLLGFQVTSAWQRTQRRQHERVPLSDEAQVEIQTAQERWIGWVQDVSAGGLRVACPTAIAEGAQVQLGLPSYLARGSSAERVARVVDCQRGLHHTSYTYILRLAFTDGTLTT